MAIIGLRGMLLTMSERYGIVNDGLVVFDDSDGVIEGVVKWGERLKYRCDVVEGGRGSIILPGFINTHTHVPMLILQGAGAGLTGFDWLKRIWWLESFLKPEHIYLSAKAAILLMAKNGITTFADHYFYEEEVARAVDETGVRGVLAKAVVDYSEHAPKHTIEDSVEFARRFNNEAGGRIKTMIGVHSMYSCSIETLEKAVQYSEETGLRIHMHFAESSHEIEYLKSRYGVTPAQLALQLGIMRTKPLLAHATYLTDGDIEYLAGHEVYVAYSPFTIMNWGQGVARVGELINRGVTVSLATDGPVTDGDLSLFKQMKVAMAAQSSRYSTPTKLSPNTVLEMATKNAAKSLGLQEQLGSLEPGLRADIIVLKPDKIKAIGLLEDPYTTVVYNLSEESISDVYVDGRKIVSNGRFTGIDQRKLYKQLLKLRKKLLDEAA